MPSGSTDASPRGPAEVIKHWGEIPGKLLVWQDRGERFIAVACGSTWARDPAPAAFAREGSRSVDPAQRQDPAAAQLPGNLFLAGGAVQGQCPDPLRYARLRIHAAGKAVGLSDATGPTSCWGSTPTQPVDHRQSRRDRPGQAAELRRPDRASHAADRRRRAGRRPAQPAKPDREVGDPRGGGGSARHSASRSRRMSSGSGWRRRSATRPRSALR